jgi:hypothetical protein
MQSAVMSVAGFKEYNDKQTKWSTGSLKETGDTRKT